VTAMPWEFDDGGRGAAGFKGTTGDCVVRALAIACGEDYKCVYDELNYRASLVRPPKRGRPSNTRTGVHRKVYEPYLLDRGFQWKPLMGIGTGTTVHLALGELPDYAFMVVSLSRHLAAVVDGVVRDNHNPTRDGTRCVYGYYHLAKRSWQ